jgi:hypothetical protein
MLRAGGRIAARIQLVGPRASQRRRRCATRPLGHLPPGGGAIKISLRCLSADDASPGSTAVVMDSRRRDLVGMISRSSSDPRSPSDRAARQQLGCPHRQYRLGGHSTSAEPPAASTSPCARRRDLRRLLMGSGEPGAEAGRRPSPVGGPGSSFSGVSGREVAGQRVGPRGTDRVQRQSWARAARTARCVAARAAGSATGPGAATMRGTTAEESPCEPRNTTRPVRAVGSAQR